METQQDTFDSAIKEYFRLKEKYENDYFVKYVEPLIKNKKKSLKEKKSSFAKLPKHQCINCERQVGTIFSSKYDKEKTIHILFAKCGDTADPCGLNIEINYSFRQELNKLLEEQLVELNNLKLDIIKEKNNALFFVHSKNESNKNNLLQKFEELSSELKTQTETYGYILEQNILLKDNPIKKDLILSKQLEFGKGLLSTFINMCKEYVSTQNEIIINNAVSFYVNEMIPELKEIQKLKYEVNLVEYDDKNNNYYLIQHPISIKSNEYYISSDDKVVHFVMNVIGKLKTKKLKPTITNNIKQTRKNKP